MAWVTFADHQERFRNMRTEELLRRARIIVGKGNHTHVNAYHAALIGELAERIKVITEGPREL